MLGLKLVRFSKKSLKARTSRELQDVYIVAEAFTSLCTRERTKSTGGEHKVERSSSMVLVFSILKFDRFKFVMCHTALLSWRPINFKAIAEL